MARDARDDRIAELERENAELRALVVSLQTALAAAEQKIRELEAQLARYSGHSSCPPSSDPPHAPPPVRRKRTGRKRGGQPGHAKPTRALVPPENVTRTYVLKPACCRRCGEALCGTDTAPYRHPIIDVPKVVAAVEEYQLHTLVCGRCNTSTRASLPVGVPTGQFGPRLQAMVSLCSGDYQMSKKSSQNATLVSSGRPPGVETPGSTLRSPLWGLRSPLHVLMRRKLQSRRDFVRWSPGF